MTKIVPFNPLEKRNLGASVAEAMLSTEAHPLGVLSRFNGAGIYAIYYSGDFPAYAPIAARNREGKFTAPIYVGKAVPEGARQGLLVSAQGASVALNTRLADHRKSIQAVEAYAQATNTQNVRLEDFHCRYLIVDDIWIPLGESLLIARFSPLWNQFLDGFGNHQPGKGRHQGMRPRWDMVHPGRKWAERHPPRLESVQEILQDVSNHLASISYPNSAHMIGT